MTLQSYYGVYNWDNHNSRRYMYPNVHCNTIYSWYSLDTPWTTKRSNQSILKEINPKYSLEDWCWSWSSNPLAMWCKELTHWKRPWCWERLKGNEKRATEDEMLRYHHQLNGHEPEKTAGDSDGQGNLACCSPWGCKVRSDSATEQQ